MTTLASLGAFALTSLLIELTPGPNMAWLALVAATEGRRPGFAAVAGVALGLAVMGGLAALGLAAMIAASPLAYQVLRGAGAAYLLWLAWDGWRGAGAAAADAPEAATLWRCFRRGLITNLLNPKAAVFFVAVLPGFLAPESGPAGAGLLAAVYVGVATVVHLAVVLAAGTARVWLGDPQRETRVRRGLSLALAGVAIWLLWKT